MAEVGKDLWVYLAHPLLQQGYPEQGALGHVQAAAEDLQRDIGRSQGCIISLLLRILECALW